MAVDSTEILLNLETAVLERNEEKTDYIIDSFRINNTDLGKRNLQEIFGLFIKMNQVLLVMFFL